MANQVEQDQLYLHYNKGLYRVLCVAKHLDTSTEHVIYYSPSRPAEVWTRPMEEFQDVVELNPNLKIQRFTLVKQQS